MVKLTITNRKWFKDTIYRFCFVLFCFLIYPTPSVLKSESQWHLKIFSVSGQCNSPTSKITEKTHSLPDTSSRVWAAGISTSVLGWMLSEVLLFLSSDAWHYLDCRIIILCTWHWKKKSHKSVRIVLYTLEQAFLTHSQ